MKPRSQHVGAELRPDLFCFGSTVTVLLLSEQSQLDPSKLKRGGCSNCLLSANCRHLANLPDHPARHHSGIVYAGIGSPRAW